MGKTRSSDTIEKERIKNSNQIDALREKGDKLRLEFEDAYAKEQVADKVAAMSDSEKEALRAELGSQTVQVHGIDATTQE